MKTYKSQLVGAAGTFALLAGLLSAAVAAPKTAAPKIAAKTASHTPTHKTTSHKTTAKSSQVTGTITSIKGSTLTIKPTLKKMGASKTVTVPSNAKVWIGSKSGKLSQLKNGQKVTVTMSGTRVTGVRSATAAMHKTAAHKTVAHKAATHKTSTAKPATHKAHA
jgi:hypothetical protein